MYELVRGSIIQGIVILTRPPIKSYDGRHKAETDDPATAVLFGGAGAGFFNDVYFLDCFTGCWSTRELAGDPPAARAYTPHPTTLH